MTERLTPYWLLCHGHSCNPSIAYVDRLISTQFTPEMGGPARLFEAQRALSYHRACDDQLDQGAVPDVWD